MAPGGYRRIKNLVSLFFLKGKHEKENSIEIFLD
jgi:hypothetical protein